MLHAKYLSLRVYTSFEEDFLSFPYISLCKTCDPWGGTNLNYVPGFKIGPAPGVTFLHRDI